MVTRIKVANIIEEGKFGGPQNRILLISNFLKKEINTTIIMPEKNSDLFKKKCRLHSIEYISLPISPMTKSFISILSYTFYFPFELYRLIKLFNKEKFDIVHISGGSWQYKGILAARFCRIKTLWHLNDTNIPLIFRLVFKLCAPLADGFAFSAQASKNYYQKYISFKCKSFIIRPPVDTNYFKPFSTKNYKSEFKNSFNNKTILIGTLSNINPVKNLEFLVKVANKLNCEIENIAFCIGGPVFDRQKGYYKKVLALIDKFNLRNIFFLGNVIDTRQFLQDIDIYVCTSLYESGPMSLYEAMSMSKPVVSTRVGDVDQIVINHKNGFVVEQGDLQSFADKIRILCRDKNIRKCYGIESRKIAVNKLDIKISGSDQTFAYKDILYSNKI